MLDRVLEYAQEAAAGNPADAALGRYLMDALGGGAEELGKGGFASSLQVCFLLYLVGCTISFEICTGHINDVLLGKPCARTSRGIRTASTRDSAVVGNTFFVRKACYTVSVLP